MIATVPRGRVDADGHLRCPGTWKGRPCRRIAMYHFRGEGRHRCHKCGLHFWANTNIDIDVNKVPEGTNYIEVDELPIEKRLRLLRERPT